MSGILKLVEDPAGILRTGNGCAQIAARIEQFNKVYKSQFLISDKVFQEVKNDILPLEHLGEVTLNGIEKNIQVHKLVCDAMIS